MRKKVNIKRFDELVERAEKFNVRSKGLKRFYPIQSRDGKILVFGMYDYQSKQHIASRPFEDVNLIFDEIENMLNKA